MKPLQLSSGDLIVDRRVNYAEMCAAAGDFAAAADLMRDTLTLAPGWAAGWFRLGELRELAGDVEAAVEAWREALRFDAADRFGASLKLALHGAALAIEAPPSAFVETLFDQYADDFDSALVERLGYRAPELIVEALARAGATAFAHVVDLGCGTGLVGERLRASASFIEGIDLSTGMLRRARAKSVYDRLVRQDLQTWRPDAAEADLVVAADVFNYVGALDRLVVSAFDALAPGGRFVFTVELLREGGDLAIRPSRRYAHARDYVLRVLAAAGFVDASLDEAELRHDRGEPVEGLVVLATKPHRPGNAQTGDAQPCAGEELTAALN